MLHCDKAEKHGNLCLGYGIRGDEPCEICKNCIKCESGYYQLGETEKDEHLTKAKEIIRAYKNICNNAPFLDEKEVELKEKAEQFLKESE